MGALVSDFSRGKTWLALDLALSVAFGLPWLGAPAVQCPVIFLIAEGNREFPMRIFGWLVEHGIVQDCATAEEIFAAWEGKTVISKYPPSFDDPDFEDGLVATIDRLSAGLVIVDTLGKTLGRDQSENDNDVANEITGRLSRIATRTGCTTLFTHHVGHGNENRARGASAWEQGLDFEYLIKGEGEELDRGEALTLIARKMRDGSFPAPVSFRLKKLTGLSLMCDDGEERIISSAVIEHVQPTAIQLSLNARIFEFVERNPWCASGAVQGGVGGRRARVKAALMALVRRGAIGNQGPGNRHAYYVMPGWRVNDQGEVENFSAEFSVADGDDSEEAA